MSTNFQIYSIRIVKNVLLDQKKSEWLTRIDESFC